MTQLPNNLITTFIELCNPFCPSLSSLPSEGGWYYISELSKLHGVTSFLYYRTRSLGIKLPEQIEKEWLGIYLYQIAEEQRARRQIKELKEILDPEQISMILLKGSSAMLRLYPRPGLRTFVDLDILIPVDKVSQYKRAMTMTGYKPLSARNSPEDEELRMFEVHLDSFWKDNGLVIEPHLTILRGTGDPLNSLAEFWQHKEETSMSGMRVCHLSREHFVIHTLLHCERNLADIGFAEIKGFVDILFALKTWRIDWLKLMDVARKWNVEKNIMPVMATLNHYWQTDIPLTEKTIPLDIKTLVLGVGDREKEYYANLPASYIKRLFKMGELKDTSSRVRYLFHLIFPTQENLRFRYNLYGKSLIMPYYLLHLFITFKKVFLGLWNQLLYHPSNNSITH